jgi:hypothetical protein
MGLERAGWRVAFANDICEKKREMYETHFGVSSHFSLGDIHKLQPEAIPRVDLATASFPCTDLSNAGGSAGHLGGALFGLAVLKSPPLKQLVIRLSQIGDQDPRKKRSSRDAAIVRETTRSPLELTKEVDRILDKISEEGIQSLTAKEKETLNRARRDR